VIDRVRAREYPGPVDGIFLNSASWGLVPRSAAEAVTDLTLRRNRAHGFEEAELGAIQRRCRRAVADLVGAEPSEIALAPNTSFGVNLAAALLASGPAGAIVLSEGEFPANVLPFRALESRGFEVRVVPAGADGLPDEDRLLDAIEAPDVVALAASSVQFASGYRMDLPRLGAGCRARGIVFVVDAIQSVGAVPFDVRSSGADLVACGGQKWLCAPWGSGFVWIRPEVQARFDPPMVSWLATADGADFDDMLHYRLAWRSNARKFELATLGIQDYLGLARSVEILLEIGVDAIERHLHALHEPVLEWIERRPDVRRVTPEDAGKRAGILSLVLPDTRAVALRLRQRGVVLSVREGMLRLAPHFYNTLDEMRSLVAMLEGDPGA
jgi:cysteine desulfurase/selenocysteine lyase